MSKETYLWSDNALKHLQDRGIKRAHSTLHKWAVDGTLPASRYEGRRRQYSADALNRFADQHFAGSHQETDMQKKFAQGGDTPMFRQQAAAPRRPGKTGGDDIRGPGAQVAKGGTMPTRSAASTAVPAASGRTGNPREPCSKPI